MRKSLFKKFFLIFTAVVFAAFIILGSIVLTFTGNYWIREKQSALVKEAKTVAGQVGAAGGNVYYASKIIDIISSVTGSDMMIVSTDGTIAVASGALLSSDTTASVPKDIMEKATQGYYSEIGNLGGLLSSECIVVSSPIVSEGTVMGAVFDFSPAAGLSIFLKNILKIFVLSVIGVMMFMLLATYLITEHLVRPIRDMAEAARCMSRGDFSKFIRVDREDEIGELAVAFNNMTKSLAVGEQLRRGFVANVSHELKTPMTTISGFIDGILDGTIPPDQHARYLEIVSAEVKRLSRLVVSMLNLSKIEAGEVAVKPAPVDLTRLLVNISLQLEQQISEKTIAVEGMDELTPASVTTDHDLMYQVIFNLVDNAIKYTPEGGRITVKNENTNGMVKLYIKNTGPGIPDKDLPFIFDRFYKVDKSRSSDKKSTGLGLYLVKTILNLLGGQITVKSTEGQYCEFVVSMPAAHVSGKNNLVEGESKHGKQQSFL